MNAKYTVFFVDSSGKKTVIATHLSPAAAMEEVEKLEQQFPGRRYIIERGS